MSDRHNDGSHHDNHQRAAELHDSAAHAHQTAAVAHDKQDHQTGQELSRRALEHSHQAHQYAEPAHRGDGKEHGITPFGHEEIAVRAYELWQARGCPEGSAEEDWFRAAHELRARGEVPRK